MVEVVNVNDVLDGHVVLALQCLDRVYLNGYVPKLQVGGQVIGFLTEHLGYPVASPALFKRIGDRFSNAVRSFAEINGIPLLHLNTPDRSRWDDRKVDHVRDYVDKTTQPGVVAIVVAQEVQKVFMGHRRRPKPDGPQFGFNKADRRVTSATLHPRPCLRLGLHQDLQLFPVSAEDVGQHDWAKRQAAADGLDCTELANGFASCPDPARLQAIADRLTDAEFFALGSGATRVPV